MTLASQVLFQVDILFILEDGMCVGCSLPSDHVYWIISAVLEKVMAVEFDHDKCTGCMACVEVCPPETIVFEQGKAVLNKEECLECGSCVRVCPLGAISIGLAK